MNASAKAETDVNLERSTRASSAFSKPVACMANRDLGSKEPSSYVSTLTLNCSLALFLAAAAKDEPLGVHRGEMFCSFEAQSNICPHDDNRFSGKIHMHYRIYVPKLVTDKIEKG